VIAPPPVTVVVDGRVVPSSQPPTIVAGTIVAPLDPYLQNLAGSVAVDQEAGTILIARGSASVVVKIGQRLARLGLADMMLPIAPYVRDGSAFIPLAAVARGLGATVSFDGRTKTLLIVLPPGEPLTTPSPYVLVPGAASPLPFRTDPTAPPSPSITSVPQPRRTPIEENP
jgi:hypothetical protein